MTKTNHHHLMRNNESNSEHLKTIQNHCIELSKTFAKLLINIGKLVNAEEGDTNAHELLQTVISVVEAQIATAQVVLLPFATRETSNKTSRCHRKIFHLLNSSVNLRSATANSQQI